MLQDLPPECLRLIVGHLATASSIVNLALTSRHFYSLISADEYASLRDFVHNAFPSIKVSPPWRDAAIRLTSRSRAWDRRAFVARECYNPFTDWKQLSSASKYGFVPAIDTYETNSIDNPGSRKEVLAYSAAGRVMLRVNRPASCDWSELRFPNDQQPHNDILDLHLLRPHQQLDSNRETIIFRRANGEVSKVETHNDSQYYCRAGDYAYPAGEINCMALSHDADPLVALCASNALHVYPIHREEYGLGPIQPAQSFRIEEPSDVRLSTRCASFLSDNLLAVGRHGAPVKIYDLDTTPSQQTTTMPLYSLHSQRKNPPRDLRANVLKQIDSLSGRAGNLLLSGWSDGLVRLYDIRAREATVATYQDCVDDGQIMSLLPIGHEKFLAGSSQNGCLKTFDLRQPGMRPYSRQDSPQLTSKVASRHVQQQNRHGKSLPAYNRREINIFLAPPVSWRRIGTWLPICRQPEGRWHGRERYRGAIYSLSCPSSASPTVYTGITDHVIQLDFVSTDDIYKTSIVDPMLRIPKGHDPNMLDVSCYERPRKGHEMTDAVLLRQQVEWADVVASKTGKDVKGKWYEVRLNPEEGWDERWKPLDRDGGRWQRRGL